MRRTSAIAVSASVLLVWLAPLGAGAVDITGTSAGFSWSAATGPVTGYAVQVSRNGGAYAEVARIAATSTRVSGQIGDTVRVRVAAYDSTGRMGSTSTPSDPVTFVEAAPPPPPPPSGGGDPVGDVDGDGVTDALAFNDGTGEVSALLVRSDGTHSWESIGKAPKSGMLPVGYADVDLDGQGDVLWRNKASGENQLWLMRGTSYSIVSLPNQPSRFLVRAFRDFNGDGAADAFFHDAVSGANELWTLGSAGRTNAVAIDPAPSGSMLAAVADVNGDASPDLVWQDTHTRALEGWLMNGADPAAAFSLPDAPDGGTCLGGGDLDGDGVEDLVWRVQTKKSRQVEAWFMDGMNAPARGVAARITKKTFVRGVIDVTSDGRAEIVLIGKRGFRALTVDPNGSQNTAGEMQWNAQPIDLDTVPASKRWNFLVLE